MPNSFFRFQQFTVHQDRCAMKVGIDGVLLGAWADVSKSNRILDVGTGTGLIALMLAQRSPNSLIDAVEIDEQACLQAQENIKQSPWSNRLRVHRCSIQDYGNDCLDRYDLIVSNPPFFENAYKSRSKAKMIARHTDALQPSDLLQASEHLLNETGRLAVIYPTDVAERFRTQAESFGLVCDRKLYIQPTPTSPIKRVLLELSRQPLPYQESILIVETCRHIYTAEYRTLTQDFYLDPADIPKRIIPQLG